MVAAILKPSCVFPLVMQLMNPMVVKSWYFPEIFCTGSDKQNHSPSLVANGKRFKAWIPLRAVFLNLWKKSVEVREEKANQDKHDKSRGESLGVRTWIFQNLSCPFAFHTIWCCVFFFHEEGHLFICLFFNISVVVYG